LREGSRACTRGFREGENFGRRGPMLKVAMI
jgi:hypothetical protein